MSYSGYYPSLPMRVPGFESQHAQRLSGNSLKGGLSEWLWRMTRNHLGFTRTGSNPVSVEFCFYKNKINSLHITNCTLKFLH